jgi:hypothetical protein
VQVAGPSATSQKETIDEKMPKMIEKVQQQMKIPEASSVNGKKATTMTEDDAMTDDTERRDTNPGSVTYISSVSNSTTITDKLSNRRIIIRMRGRGGNNAMA